LGHYVKIELSPDVAMVVNATVEGKFVNYYFTARLIRTIFFFCKKASLYLDEGFDWRAYGIPHPSPRSALHHSLKL
jgi:hypothetical protein